MNITFTPAQAIHAQEVADELYKKRRFFLPKGTTAENPLPFLSPDIFSYLYGIEKMFDDKYHFIRRRAEAELHMLELDHGVTPAKISDRHRIVDCNRYSGGLEIVAVVPVSTLLFQMGKPDDNLAEKLLEEHYPHSTRGDMTQNSLNELKSNFESYGSNLAKDLLRFSQDTSARTKALVVLNTRFEPSSTSDDFMQGKLDGLITYPHLASWTLYKNAQRDIRLSGTGFTIFNSSRSGHVALDLNATVPRLAPNKKHGYECRIAFATIL